LQLVAIRKRLEYFTVVLNTKILSCLVSYRDPIKLTKALECQQCMLVPAGYELELYVFDNSEDQTLVPKLQELCTGVKAKLVVLEKNVGVSGAYAQAAKIAIDENFGFLWLWDQDSEPDSHCLQGLVKTFATHMPNPNEPLGVVVPKLHDPTGQDQHWVFNADPYDLAMMRTHRFPMNWVESGVVRTRFMINSGALLSRQLLETVGAPDPDFFMDLVDFEFSSRIVRSGFKILMNADSVIQHSVGTPVRFQFLWRTLWARNYPIFRYYYQAKNEMLLAKKGTRPASLLLKANVRLFLRPIKILYDREKTGKKICAHFLGWWHGLLGLKGRTHSKWMTS
jgi:GT2 family glycosyltransferase